MNENGDFKDGDDFSDDDRMSATMGRTNDKLSGLMPSGSGGGGDMMSQFAVMMNMMQGGAGP